MYVPLARSDYYEASAPPNGHQLATSLPIHRPGRAAGGRPRMVPTFTQHRSTRSAASSTPAASPCLRRSLSAWPPHRRIHSASELTHMQKHTPGHALHPGPYPPDLSRHSSYGASATGSLTFRLLILLAGPGPSGDTKPSRRCRGCSCPPGVPRLRLPPASPRRCDDAAERSFTSLDAMHLVAHEPVGSGLEPGLPLGLQRVPDPSLMASVQDHGDVCFILLSFPGVVWLGF